VNIQTRLEPKFGTLVLNTSFCTALFINTSAAFILFTGGGWKCQNAQGRVVFMTSPTWPDVPSRKNLPEKALGIQFPAQFCEFSWQNHHSESSLATPRERGDSLTCLMCCKNIQRPKCTADACTSSSAGREILVHPWTEERGGRTAEGSQFAPLFAGEMGLKQTLGVHHPAPVPGTPRDPMCNTRHTSLSWFTV